MIFTQSVKEIPYILSSSSGPVQLEKLIRSYYFYSCKINFPLSYHQC